MQASRSGGKAAQSLWQLYVQQRSQSIGSTLPSSKSLWDVVNRRLLEPHGAEAVRDIWMQVRAPVAACRSGLHTRAMHCVVALAMACQRTLGANPHAPAVSLGPF
jgi:hypothetical protein